MSEPIPVPPQAVPERIKLTIMWIGLAIVGTLIVVANPPYEFAKQSPISLKSEICRGIQAVRAKSGHWVKQSSDPEFKFGTMANNESTRPFFEFIKAKFNSSKEVGVYRLNIRREVYIVEVEYDPNAKPKKALF